MSGYKRWFCSCKGSPRELVADPYVEEDSLEPTCPLCGATPSSDPRHTLSFTEQEDPPD